MAEAFKVGDVVRLKSGGPRMTVVQLHEGVPSVRCTWFVDGKTEQKDFPRDALEKDEGGLAVA